MHVKCAAFKKHLKPEKVQPAAPPRLHAVGHKRVHGLTRCMHVKAPRSKAREYPASSATSTACCEAATATNKEQSTLERAALQTLIFPSQQPHLDCMLWGDDVVPVWVAHGELGAHIIKLLAPVCRKGGRGKYTILSTFSTIRRSICVGRTDNSRCKTHMHPFGPIPAVMSTLMVLRVWQQAPIPA
jgi:hypothetical protein